MSEERDTAWEGVRGAALDRESGSAEIARRAADALAALPRGDLEDAVAALVRGHPSMAALWRLGADVLLSDDHAAAAAAFAGALAREEPGVAAAAAPLLDAPVIVHSYSGTVVAAVIAAGVAALCGRSDPGGEGDRTARRMAQAGCPAAVVEDREALAAASRGRTVVVGADALGPGGVVNKVGTGALAEAARRGGGRCYVLAGGSKLVAVDVPAPRPFERIPLHAFTAVVTGSGALDPRDAARLASRFPLPPALSALLP